MSDAGDQNPYQSPDVLEGAAPWRKRHVWWGASFVLVAIALAWIYVGAFFGALLVVGALAVSCRSAIVLHRKFQAGWPITSSIQFNAVAASFFILLAAFIASFIAFFVSCISISVVTRTPFGLMSEEMAREYAVPMTTIALIAGFIGLAVLSLLTWFSRPTSLANLQAARLEKKRATSETQGAESDG